MRIKIKTNDIVIARQNSVCLYNPVALSVKRITETNNASFITPLELSGRLRQMSKKDTWKNISLNGVPEKLLSYSIAIDKIAKRIDNLKNYLKCLEMYDAVDLEVQELFVKNILTSVSISNEELNRINELCDKIKNGTATNVEQIEYINLYNKQFTEEELKNLYDFFFFFSEEDGLNIQMMLYTADEPIRSELINMLKGGTIKFRFITDDVSSYNHGDNVLSINPDNLSRTDRRGQYYVIWHELGHALDDHKSTLNGNEGISWTRTFKTEDGKTINDLIKENLRTTIYDRCEKEYKNLSDTDKEEIANYLISGRVTDVSSKNKSRAEKVGNQISAELNHNRDFATSDAYSCITDHGIIPKKNYHPKDYNDTYAMMEAYADYVANSVTDNKKAFDSYKYYMPSVYNEIKKSFNQ